MVELCSTVRPSPCVYPFLPMDTWAVCTSWLLRISLQGRAESPFSVLLCINSGEEFPGHMVILGSFLWFLSTSLVSALVSTARTSAFLFILTCVVRCDSEVRFPHFRKTIYIPECCLSPGLSGLFLRNVI